MNLDGTAKVHIHTLHNIILLGIIRMLLTRNLQNSRNSLIIILQNMPDIIGNVLIDENDSNIVPLGKVEEGFFYLLEFGVGFDD